MANPFEEDLEPWDRNQEGQESRAQQQQQQQSNFGSFKFGGDDQVEIKEGLLCPICVKEFPTIASLENHFQTSHASSSSGATADGNGSSNFDPSSFSNRLFGNQIRGLLNKTRKKILTNDRDVDARGASVFGDSFDEDAMPRSGYEDFKHYLRSGQTMGPIKSHYSFFKNVRDTRIERYVLETNKLLIRLDKLITDAPQDPEKRKSHEKAIVNWVNDEDVKLCPNCARQFNLSRRRHHCRLCGAIMCHACSQFIDFDYARRLVGPINLEASEVLTDTRSSLSKGSSKSQSQTALNRSFSLVPAALGRRGSATSLISVVNAATGEPQIRVCCECKKLLDKRDQQIEERTCKPIVAQMYDRMRGFMNEIDKLVPLYCQMSYSLSIGETNYNLHDAQELRIKVMRLAESVEMISKKIGALGLQDEIPPIAKQLQLQSKIRMGVTHYLKETIFALPSLPTEDQLEELREKRRQEIQRKIELEKRAALEAQQARERSTSPSSNGMRGQGTPRRVASAPNHLGKGQFNNQKPPEAVVSPDTGWGISAKNEHIPDAEDADPMLVQINIIRNYIKQARESHKYDEVGMLENNLRELEIEYFMQQHGVGTAPRTSTQSENVESHTLPQENES